MLTRIWVELTVINLRNYVLGGFHVALRTMRCTHGSINQIPMEWDPGPTYDVQRLWDPSLESDNPYVFLSLETQVYKYIYVIVDHWFFWVTG